MSARVRRPRDHVTPPPPPKSPKPVIKKWAKAQGGLLRIYTASTHTPDELTFRHYGPALRFDHHRGSMAAAEVDAERGIWYGAALKQPSGMVSALEVCMWECFGAERRVDMSRFLGRVQVRDGESLRLLDLTGAKAIEAGTIKQLTNTPNPEDSQEWSRFFYERDDLYGEIDGLLFESAWCGGRNVALYERARPKLEPFEIGSLPLGDRLLSGEVATIAVKRGWSIATAVL